MENQDDFALPSSTTPVENQDDFALPSSTTPVESKQLQDWLAIELQAREFPAALPGPPTPPDLAAAAEVLAAQLWPLTLKLSILLGKPPVQCFDLLASTIVEATPHTADAIYVADIRTAYIQYAQVHAHECGYMASEFK